MINEKISYNKDTVFDSINLKDYLKAPIYIQKTSKEKFIYYQDLIQENENRNISTRNKETEQELYNEINNNPFDLNIETLKINHKINFIDLYKPLKYIGKGSFGLVISVKQIATGQIFAAKIIKKTDPKSNQEEKIIKYLNHPRIIKLHEVINLENYLILLMDLMEGGSLKDFIINKYISNKKNNKNENYFITDEESSIIIKNILEGLNYIHKMGIIHRDLKPENIMFKKPLDINSLTICDFGISDDISNEDICGTTIYMSPEMLKERFYDNLTDIYACGIILYILESGGQHPFFYYNISRNQYINKVLKNEKWNFPNYFPNLARNLFMKLCKFEPSYRYSSSKGLKHPWICRNIDNEKIPLNLFESFEKIDKIKNFKGMISSLLFFNMFKSLNPNFFQQKKKKTHLNCKLFLKSPFDNNTQKKRNVYIFNYKNNKSNSQNSLPEIINLTKSSSAKKFNLIPIKKRKVPYLNYKINCNNDKEKRRTILLCQRNEGYLKRKNSLLSTKSNIDDNINYLTIRTSKLIVKSNSLKLNPLYKISKYSLSPTILKYNNKIRKQLN